MSDEEFLNTGLLTGSLPPLQEIPDLENLPDFSDIPDIPENVINVSAVSPLTSESLVLPSSQSMDTTLTGTNTALTYVAQQNISFGDELLAMASDDTTTTINIPTATEVLIEQSPSVPAHNTGQIETGPSSPKNEKTDDSVFVIPFRPPLRPLTRITRNIPKSIPSGENKTIQSLLSQKSTLCLTRVTASRPRDCIVTASAQTPGVSASMPVLLRNLPPGILTQRPRLQSALVQTTTAADFIPRSSSVDSVITTHVTTTTAMSAAPQQSYPISPIRATPGYTSFTTTVSTSTSKSILLISNPPPPRARTAEVTQFKPPAQHWYKVRPNAAAKMFHNLVRSKALPDSPRATVASPPSIAMPNPHSLIATATDAATSVHPSPSTNTRANYAHNEPGQRNILERLSPRSFPGPLTASPYQRQASAMQQQAESQAMTGLVRGPAPLMQHAVSLQDEREASPGRLVGASQEVRLKAHQQGLLLVTSRPQNEYFTTSQLQGQSLAASRPQNEHFTTAQLQGQPLAASRPLNDSLLNSLLQSQPLATSHQQGLLLATSHQPNQLLATSKSRVHHLVTSQAQLLSTSQSQGPILITSKQHAQGLAKSQSQDAISVATQQQALLATTQSQAQAQSHAILPTPPNVTLPVQIKPTQANATLIAQLNAPPQKIISRGQQSFPRMLIQRTPAQLKNITQAQLNTIAQAQMKTSQKRKRTALPVRTPMISPPRQSAAQGHPRPCPSCCKKKTKGNSAPPIATQSATREPVAASTSLNEQRPITSNASQKIDEVPSCSKQSTETLTLSPGTHLIMPNYKSIVFKNLLALGRGEPTPLPTPTTTSGEKIVIRRTTAYCPARRSFPTTTQSLKAPVITTPKMKVTAIPTHKTETAPKPVHVLRTVSRHVVASLEPGHARTRPNNSQIPTFIINQNNSSREQASEVKNEEISDETREEETEENN